MDSEVPRVGRTQKVMADQLAGELHLHSRVARHFVERFLQMLGDDLVDTGRVELRGFGIFGLETRPAHTVKHPKTGKPVKVPEKKEVRFRASVDIRKRLNPPKGKKPKNVPAASSDKIGSKAEAGRRSRPRRATSG